MPEGKNKTMIKISNKKNKEISFYQRYHLSDKKKKNLHLYMRYIANPLSYPLFRLLIKTPITATQISYIIIILGLISPVFIALGNKTFTLIGCLLLQLAVILDCVDGSIARYRNQKSFMGKYLDILFHDTSVPLLFIGIGINAFNNLGNVLYIYIGILTSLFIILANMSRSVKYTVIITYIMLKKEHSLRKNHLYSFKGIEYSKNPFKKFAIEFLKFFNEFSHIFTFSLIFTIMGYLPYLLFFYLPFYFLMFIVKVAIELREEFSKLIIKK